MEKSHRISHSSVLVGIGLVLVGLLAGILVMLLVVDTRPANTVMPQVVERVELGKPAPQQPASITGATEAAPALDLVSINSMFKAVANDVTQAVVYIQVEGAGSGDFPRDWFHNFEEEGGGERLFRDMPRQSVGSGVIISKQGYIVTNLHVVDQARAIQITLSDKRQFEAHIVGVDASTDLAVIKVENPEDFPVIALGNSDRLEVGEWVLAVGNPFRLTSTVTAGIISALGRQVNIIEDRFRIEDFIQTDAAINPGNSGGALVNLEGELVGINTAIATESGSYEGYGFAVPVNLVERVVRDLISYGEVRRGFLGVSIQTINAVAARRLGMDQVGGVYLDEVQDGGAADRGGLQEGDVVIAINGESINASNELQSVIARLRPGDQVSVDVWRRGERQKHQVTLLGRDDPAYKNWFAELEPIPQPVPEEEPAYPSTEVFQLDGWGLGLRDLTSRDRNAFDVEDGVYLAYVEKETVADNAGLPRDAVLLAIGETPVNSVEDAIRILALSEAHSGDLLLRVRRRTGIDSFYELEVPSVE